MQSIDNASARLAVLRNAAPNKLRREKVLKILVKAKMEESRLGLSILDEGALRMSNFAIVIDFQQRPYRMLAMLFIFGTILCKIVAAVLAIT